MIPRGARGAVPGGHRTIHARRARKRRHAHGAGAGRGHRALERNERSLVASTTSSSTSGDASAARERGRAAPTCFARRSRATWSASPSAASPRRPISALRSLDAQIVVLENTIRLRRDSFDHRADARFRWPRPELDVHQAQGALSDALVQRARRGRTRALLERQLAQLSGKLDLKLAGGRSLRFAQSLPRRPPACPPACSSAVPTSAPPSRA